MRVYPHILLKTGDIIRLPGGNSDHIARVVDLIEGYLLVECYNNRFILPRGFYLKQEGYFVPLRDFDGSYFHFEDDKNWDFCE